MKSLAQGHTRVSGKMGLEPGRSSRSRSGPPTQHELHCLLDGPASPQGGGVTFCTFLSLSFAPRRCLLVTELDVGDNLKTKPKTNE